MSDLASLTQRVTPDGKRQSGFRIVCGRCGVDDFLVCKGDPWPRAQIESHFRHRRWLVSAKGHHRCGDCDKAGRAELRAARAQRRADHHATEEAAMGPAISPEAREKRRLVTTALDSYYDLKAQRYRDNHSDASIARECEVAEAFVAKRREEDYGPLAVDHFLADVAREIDGFSQDRLALEKLGARLDAERKQALDAVIAFGLMLDTRISRLRKMIDQRAAGSAP